MTAKEKEENNIWDKIQDVIKVLQLVRRGEWTWCRNTDCKYIDVRIDMRYGICKIFNNNGERINPEELEKQ